MALCSRKGRVFVLEVIVEILITGALNDLCSELILFTIITLDGPKTSAPLNQKPNLGKNELAKPNWGNNELEIRIPRAVWGTHLKKLRKN